MGAITVLDAATDASRWLELLAQLTSDRRDVYFRPEYVGLYAGENEQALLFTYIEGGGVWLHPFVTRPLPPEFADAAGAGAADVESAYGYGGPLSSSDDAAFGERANREFCRWCRERGVIAEFLRLHPLLRNERWLAAATVRPDRTTVSLDLGTGDEPQIPANGRDMVRRAERAGVRVTAGDWNSLPEFLRLYRGTMDRIGADEFYYFDDAYFDSLRARLGAHAWLVTARCDGELAAGAIFLRGTDTLHYHLSASDPAKRIPGATNAVLHCAAILAQKEGLKRLHLGGGTSADPADSLLAFKRKMATDSHQFSIASRVHDPDAYSRVRRVWSERHPSLSASHGSRVLFYRSPAVRNPAPPAHAFATQAHGRT